ncbi:endonuclease V [Pelomyxa schiedti]|nr:endonuclease V [Pelomyxa schiedti]
MAAVSVGETLAQPSDEIKANWEREQLELKRRLRTDDVHPEWSVLPSTSNLRLIGGTDISFVKGSPVDACASIVVLSYPALKVVYEAYSMVKLTAPYISGFLAFREAPLLLPMIEELRATKPDLLPQVFLVDGNGILHPRGFGLASHLGVLANIPTVGVAKKTMLVDGVGIDECDQIFQTQCQSPGSHAVLVGNSGTTLGAIVRPPNGCNKALYVSPGHLVSLDTAVSLTLVTCKVRIPEPIRQADLRSRDHIRKMTAPPSKPKGKKT